MSADEAKTLIAGMETEADIAPEVELSPENWVSLFGNDGIVDTPIGKVKMGENQYFKLAQRGREGKLGMIKPTLETPVVIIEDSRPVSTGGIAERGTSYVFIKTFLKEDGTRYYHFTSVTVSKDGREVVVSNQEKSVNRISKLLQQGNVAWMNTSFSLHPKTQIGKSVSLNGSNKPTSTDNRSALLGINPSELFAGKDTEKSSSAQGNEEKKDVVAEVVAAEAQTDTSPTEAQKKAGNYKKGHVKVDGHDVTIENPKGSTRSGRDADGKEWSVRMNNTYGYIRGTEGVDGDHIDVFLSDKPEEGDVWVIDQVDPKAGAFDEHKVMYGFSSEDEARKAYLSNYSPGWKGLGAITHVSKDEFKKWIDSSHRKTKPFAEYKSVKNKETLSVQGLEGYTLSEIKDIARVYIEQRLNENGFSANVEGIEIHGSRARGNARDDSDLDIVVEYSGDEREDDMFNLLNDGDEALNIEGIRVDINPIRAQETGTLDKYMERSRKYDEEVLKNEKAEKPVQKSGEDLFDYMERVSKWEEEKLREKDKAESGRGTRASAEKGSDSSAKSKEKTEKEAFAEWLYANRMNGDTRGDREEPGKYLWWLWERCGATLEAINWYIHERTKFQEHSKMASEYPSDDVEAFAHSGERVFDMYQVEALRVSCRAPRYVGDVIGRGIRGKDALRDLRFTEDGQGLLWIWSKPDIDEAEKVTDRYAVVVDIGGRGRKSDWSVVVVFDRYYQMEGGRPMVVAQWYGHIDMDLLAWKAAQIAAYYDNALLVIESNTLETHDPARQVDGDQSLYILTQLAGVYPNLYARVRDETDVKEGAEVKYGFHTNVSTKPMVISVLIMCVREKLYVERDDRCLDEMLTYEKEGNKFNAIDGAHDDLLMTRAIGLHVCLNEMAMPRVVPRVKSAVMRPRRIVNEASM